MRFFPGKVRFGFLFDAVLFVALLVLFIAFIHRRGHSLPRVKISFEPPDDERHLTDAARSSSRKKTRNAAEDDEYALERRRVTYADGSSGVLSEDVIVSQLKLLPDVRSSKCRDVTYDVDKLKRSTTLVVHFTDYELYDAQVTISSVLLDVEDVDLQTLAEIIVVDAGSNVDHIRNEADEYIKNLRTRHDSERRIRYLPPVRLMRATNGGASESRKWPREFAMKVAQTDVVVFIDPGVVVRRGWLAPLVKPLVDGEDDAKQNERPSAVESHLDRLRHPVSFEYELTDDEYVPAPSWSLSVRMRYLSEFDDNGRKVTSGGSIYRSVPVLRGSAFAVRTPDMESLGGLFDKMLQVDGGGEHLELSLRLWMCGNGIKATCSRVGVPNIDDDVRVKSPSNARRIAEAWFASRSSLVARFGGHIGFDEAPTSAGATTPSRDECKDIEWYMKTAAAGSLFAPQKSDSTEFGLLQVQTNRCARISDGSRIDLDVCDPQPELYFELTADGQLLATATGLCLTVTKTYYITAEECKNPLEKTQKWEYKANGELQNRQSGGCATHVTDPDPQHDGGQIMMAQNCHPGDEKHEQFKIWQFMLP